VQTQKKSFHKDARALEKNSEERVKSLEDATSRKKRENRQVCAGTYRFGVCRVLILTLLIRFAQSENESFTSIGRHFFISSISSKYCRAPFICWIDGLIRTFPTSSPSKHEVGVVKFGSVWENEGVLGRVGKFVLVSDRDSQPYFRVLIGLAKGVDCSLCLFSVFTVF